MRDIKFRGICPNEGFWVYGYYAKRVASHHLILDGGATYHADPDSIGQYTGLKDNHGVEIYEGDICRFDTMIPKIDGIGYVYWSVKGGCWMAQTKLPFLLHRAMSVEVIGNIHDNPELLTEGQSLIKE